MHANTEQPRRRRRLVWAVSAVLAVVTFTPLVIPPYRIEPRLAAMPYTLWAGMIVAALFVGLTAAATRLYSGDEPGRDGDRE